MMKALQHLKYGDVGNLDECLKLTTTEQIPSPSSDQVLIKIHCIALNFVDYAMVRGSPFLLRFLNGFPQPNKSILGSAISGVITQIGTNVTQFSVNDQVMIDTSEVQQNGIAEYIVVSASHPGIILKPAQMSYVDAACLPVASVTALHTIRDKAKVQQNERVLIYGASGAVGFSCIQIAKYYGAHVTAIVSTRNTETAAALGADEVIDYKENENCLGEMNEKFDVVVAANGSRSIFEYKAVLKSDHGRYLCCGGSLSQIFASILLGGVMTLWSGKDGQSFGNVYSTGIREDMEFVAELMVNGKIKAVVDKSRFGLDTAVDAFEYILSGKAVGRVVIEVVSEQQK